MKNFCFYVLLLGSIRGLSQDHTQFWTRITVQSNISKKLSTSLEFNHRTQSALNTESPFRFPLMNAIRFGLSYKIDKRQTIYFSPYAFFSNDPVINGASDMTKQHINEHRLWIQYESRLPMNKKWTWINRNGIEYRIFEANTALCRVRIREGISYRLSNELSLMLSDEIFTNTINSSTTNLFDQNRIGVQSIYTISKHLKLDFGTILINQKLRNSPAISTNYVFFFNVLYTL